MPFEYILPLKLLAFFNLKFRQVFEILGISRPISVADSIGDSLDAKITPATSGPFSFTGDTYRTGQNARSPVGREIEKKKFFFFSCARLDPVDSRIRDARNQTEHLVHSTPSHQVVL